MTAPPLQRISPKLCLLAAIIGGLSFGQVYSLQSVLPALMHDLNTDAVGAGSSIGAALLAMALASPFIGIISDTFGRRRLIIGAALFLALPTVAIAFAGNIGTVWWWRFLQGATVPGMTVVLLAYIAEEFPLSDRIRLTSFYISGSILGGFLGRLLTGYLNESLGWRQAMIVLAAASLLGGAYVYRTLPPSRRFSPQTKGGIGTAFKRHLTHPQLYTSCLLGFCLSFCLMGCFTYVNLHLAKAPYLFNTAQLGNVFAVYLLGMAVTPPAGLLMVRFGLRPTASAATLLTAAGLLLSLHPSLSLLITALALTSCGIFIAQTAAISHLNRHISQNRSLASGLYYTGYYSGGFCGTWLCGHAFARYGWNGTVTTMLAVQILAVLLCIFHMKPPPQPT